jgi:DNA polymerase elongation subunit (family B)
MIHLPPANRLFYLDVETASEKQFYSELSPSWQALWRQKATRIDASKDPEELYPKAAIYAEFGKIVCISIGSIDEKNNELRITSFYGFDERKILLEFSGWAVEFLSNQSVLAAHNGKEFDFPWIARRLAIQGIPIPKPFRLFGKKPWETPHIDTLELWKCGDYKHYTSLELLATAFDIQSPKSQLNGEKIHKAFWEEEDLAGIASYCAADVETLARLIGKLCAAEPIHTVRNRFIKCSADQEIFTEIACD